MAEVVNEIEETIDVSMSDAQFALLRGKYPIKLLSLVDGDSSTHSLTHSPTYLLTHVRVIYYHSTRLFDVVIAAAAVRPSERTVVFNINT